MCALTSFYFYRQGTCCSCAVYSLLDHWPKLRPCCACFSPAIFLCARPSRTRAPPLQGEHCLMSAALSGVQGHRQPQAPSAERTKPDGGSEVGREETLLVQHWCVCLCGLGLYNPEEVPWPAKLTKPLARTSLLWRGDCSWIADHRSCVSVCVRVFVLVRAFVHVCTCTRECECVYALRMWGGQFKAYRTPWRRSVRMCGIIHFGVDLCLSPPPLSFLLL